MSRLFSFRTLFHLLFCFTFFSCTKGGNEPDEEIPNDPVYTSFGEYFPVPGTNVNTNFNDIFYSLRVNNMGVYFLAENLTAGEKWICRLNKESSVSNPRWKIEKFPKRVTFMPAKRTNELPDEFSIFYNKWIDQFGIDATAASGYLHYNNNLPSSTPEINPSLSSSNWDEIRVDNSPQRYNWLIHDNDDYNNKAIIKYRSASGAWGLVKDFRNYHLVTINIEFDDNDAVVWIPFSTLVDPNTPKLMRLTISGQEQVINLPSAPMSQVTGEQKIRVRNNIVFAKFTNKLYKITDNTNIELFKTFSSENIDFAVDDQYVYTTEGEKIDIKSRTTTRFIPEPPSKQEELNNYNKMLAHLKAGRIETSTDPLDKYIYCLPVDHPAILRIKVN